MTSQKRSQIPNFKNRQEMAQWFDAHNIADYQDEFKTVEARFAKNLVDTINVRFDPRDLEKIRKIAQRKGVGPSTLVRMWAMERLSVG